MSSVLVVDGRAERRRALVDLLGRDGHAVHQTRGVGEALTLLGSFPVDVVLAVVQVESDGVALLSHIKAHALDTEVITFYDSVPIPEDPDRVLRIVREAIDKHRHVTGLQHLAWSDGPDSDVVAIDPKTRAVFAAAARVADVNSTVLITGESGTGKEVVARVIHLYGDRRRAQFVPVNCAAIPEALVESELFGYRKGSFTGALADRKGLIETAGGGVLFLDEVGEMSPQMQVRLLRFLDSGEIRRVGDTVIRHVDVRVIAATNRMLAKEVANGRFRQDLFYRLSVISICVPPLRERPEDILELAHRHLRRMAVRLKKCVRLFSKEAMSLLQAYSWPGNVRELHNVVEAAVIAATSEAITADDLPIPPMMIESSIDAGVPLDAESERQYLIAALERFRGNHTQAAAALGMSRTTLWRRLRRLGVAS